MANEGKVVSTAFGLCAFAVALVAGVAAGNSSLQVLLRAIVAMLVCQLIGMLVGAMFTRIVAAHVDSYRELNPVVDVPAVSTRGKEAIAVVDEVVDETGAARRAA